MQARGRRWWSILVVRGLCILQCSLAPWDYVELIQMLFLISKGIESCTSGKLAQVLFLLLLFFLSLEFTLLRSIRGWFQKRSFDRYHYRPCQSFRVGQLKGENQTNRWGYGFLKNIPFFSEKADHKKIISELIKTHIGENVRSVIINKFRAK